MFLTLSLKVAKFQAVRNKAHVNAFSDIAAPRRLHAPRLSGKGAARCLRDGTVKKGGTIGKVKSNVSNSKKKTGVLYASIQNTGNQAHIQLRPSAPAGTQRYDGHDHLLHGEAAMLEGVLIILNVIIIIVGIGKETAARSKNIGR